MKPVTTNNLNTWGYVGLFILFCMPYIGTPALLFCAIFVRDHATKSFARAILLLSLLSIVLVVVVAILGLINLGDFNFDVDNGVQVFNYLRGFLRF